MHRHPHLHGLSSDHHDALVLVRELERAAASWTRTDGEALAVRFARELEPHFAIEESLLLPALRALGRSALVERVLADHARLRADIVAAATGDASALRSFAAKLVEHVRFEERELFPTCEHELAASILEEVARRSPPPRGRGPRQEPPPHM
ncbi:MAG: hemerythrin domain-containing protein [Planctomycetes bacterium]|nr:hemerythrin domain-containing protein [Planctomycetota bacterium]